MKATHISIEHLNTNRKVANRALKAFNDITECDNGTIKNSYELASSTLKDGRTLIQAIYEDGEVIYNDGWYVVELVDGILYVDLTGLACREMGLGKYECISEFEDE